MLKSAVFPIGVISELLEVHPETLRVWERNGIVIPVRRSGRRFYSQTDLQRLRFIQKLMSEDLNLPAVKHYLHLYPCWQLEDCPACMHASKVASCAKRCWKDEGTYCQVTAGENACSRCNFCPKH
jgi:MerR family transcriptional regulator, heat shock protein HspR